MAAAAGLSGAAAATRSLTSDGSSTCGSRWASPLGAIPAVLVAAFMVKEMPVEMLRWLVVAVVTYAAITLLVSAVSKTDLVPDDAAEAAVTHE